MRKNRKQNRKAKCKNVQKMFNPLFVAADKADFRVKELYSLNLGNAKSELSGHFGVILESNGLKNPQ